jgi:hypothetical protein
MVSSLALLRGSGYHYIDHPGTPVEVLGTVLLAATYPFVMATNQDFITFHLSHPEVFMALAQTLLLVCTLLTCALLAMRALPSVVHWSQALSAVAVVGVFFAIHPDGFETLAVWSHNFFSFWAGTLLSLCLVLVVRRPKSPSLGNVVALGIAAGVLTSVQLYFGAWVIGTSVALGAAARLHGLPWRRSLMRGAAAVGAAGIGFVVATLPIRDHYLELVVWIHNLMSHQGIYGAGPEGFSTSELMGASFATLFAHDPLLFLAFGVIVALLVARMVLAALTHCYKPSLWAAGLGLLVQSLVILVLTLKHPGCTICYRSLQPHPCCSPPQQATWIHSRGLAEVS